MQSILSFQSSEEVVDRVQTQRYVRQNCDKLRTKLTNENRPTTSLFLLLLVLALKALVALQFARGDRWRQRSDRLLEVCSAHSDANYFLARLITPHRETRKTLHLNLRSNRILPNFIGSSGFDCGHHFIQCNRKGVRSQSIKISTFRVSERNNRIQLHSFNQYQLNCSDTMQQSPSYSYSASGGIFSSVRAECFPASPCPQPLPNRAVYRDYK